MSVCLSVGQSVSVSLLVKTRNSIFCLHKLFGQKENHRTILNSVKREAKGAELLLGRGAGISPLDIKMHSVRARDEQGEMEPGGPVPLALYTHIYIYGLAYVCVCVGGRVVAEREREGLAPADI